MSTLWKSTTRPRNRTGFIINFFTTSSENERKAVEAEYYSFQDAILRIFKGDITLADIHSMTRKELLAMLQARMDSIKRDGGKQEAFRSMMRDMS